MSRLLLSAAGLLLLSSSSFAAPAHTVKAAAKPAAIICPVTGEKIASVKDAIGSSVYKGKKYYFCCSSCKPAFDASPAKYVKTAAVR